MGILYSLDTPKNILYIVWKGEIKAETWFNQVRKLTAEPDWPAISRVIVDLQNASTNVINQDIETIATLFGEHPGQVVKKRVAVLANELFGKAKTFGGLLERFGVSLVVFTSFYTACTFLGLIPTETEEALKQLRLTLDHQTDSAAT